MKTVNMENTISHIDDLMLRFLAGETTRAENKELWLWRQESAENDARFRRRQELWFSSLNAENISRFDSDRAFNAFMQKRNLAESKSHRRLFKAFKYAAAACILFGAVFYTAFKIGRQDVTRTFADIVIEAPAGSNTVTTLPDGTTVTLNAGSRLSYSQGYGVQNRRVMFSGEGYFNVKKHSELPFTIETASLIVEDLGTKFNFSDYKDDETAVLKLDEGKVSMQGREADAQKYLLNPNQKAVFNKADGAMKIENTLAEKSHEWTEGKLVFNGESFAKVEKVLERAYGVDISVADKHLYQLRFHGEFSRNSDRIEDVLGTFAKTGKLRFKVNEQHITIY